jgi:hypothetical protein
MLAVNLDKTHRHTIGLSFNIRLKHCGEAVLVDQRVPMNMPLKANGEGTKLADRLRVVMR